MTDKFRNSAVEAIARLQAVLDVLLIEKLDVVQLHALLSIAGRVLAANAKERGLHGLLHNHNPSTKSRAVTKLVDKGFVTSHRSYARSANHVDITPSGENFVRKIFGLLFGTGIELGNAEVESVSGDALRQLSWHAPSCTLLLLGEDYDGEVARWLEENGQASLEAKAGTLSIRFTCEYQAALFKLKFC